MKANAANLLNLLKNPQQFIIPIYQRSYNWKEKHCEQLLKDILRISQEENSSGHFIGSVVYFQEGIGTVTSIPKLLVIDGQQRLTTLTLIFLVLARIIRENNLDVDMTDKKIRNYYLVNSDEDGELRYKLLLTRSDKSTLMDLIEGRDTDLQSSRDLVRNYQFFLNRITRENARHVLTGMQRLFIVDVALEYGKDNPQLIFESLNSTGLDLSQADLIRNYILMDLPPDRQRDLYERYWYPMEQLFGDRYSELFDGFIRDYLILKTGIIPKIENIYPEFKNHIWGNGKQGDIEAIVSDLHHNARLYARFVLLKEPDGELNQLFANLDALKVNVSYPFILFLYDAYEQKVLSIDEFRAVVGLIESYVYRRAVCGIPTNSLNKTFAGFRKHIRAERFYESTLAHFLLMDSYRRFPNDREFRESFVARDLYNTRTVKYVLAKLENYSHKEKINVDDYTIEHIMPQNPNLSKEWQTMLGPDWKEVQEKYLHCIGNITLTGYNSEMSDHPFTEKQKMPGGFAESHIKLNHGLEKLTIWNEEEIMVRANGLALKSLDIWKHPVLNQEVLNSYAPAAKVTSLKVPHNLKELIQDEPQVVPAMTSPGYVRFKPGILIELKDRYVSNGLITESVDLLKSYLLWFEFVVTEESIKFAFIIGDHDDQLRRQRVYKVFKRFSHYYPYLNRTLRPHWHTVFTKEIITPQEYEALSDEEDNEELLVLIAERFRELIDIELPKVNEMLYALAE